MVADESAQTIDQMKLEGGKQSPRSCAGLLISCLSGELEIVVEEGGDHDGLRAVWTIREGEREDSNDEEAFYESLRYFYKRADGELFQFALREEHEDIVVDAMSEHVAPVSGTKTVILKHLACRKVLEFLKNQFEEEEKTSGGQNVSFCGEDTDINEGTGGEINDFSDKEPTIMCLPEIGPRRRGSGSKLIGGLICLV